MNGRPRNKIVDLIFDNIQIVALLFVFLVVAGAAAFFNLNREGFPGIPINIVMVSTTLPGATPIQIEDQVLKPLESALSDIDSVKEYETVGGNSFGIAVATIDEQADFNDAFREISDEMNKVKLPTDASDIEVSQIEADSDDFFIALAGIDDPWELYQESKDIQEELESVTGVKSVTVLNPVVPRILIDFDRGRLAAHGLTRQKVEESLKLAHVDLPIGSFIDEGDTKINLGLTQKFSSPNEIRDFEMAEGVRLTDIATVWVDLDNQDRYNRVGYRPDRDIDEDMRVERAIVMGVRAKDGVDLIRLSRSLNESYAEIERDLPSGAEIAKFYSLAEYTELQINEIKSGVFGRHIEALGPFGIIGYLFGAIGLVLILLFIFINLRVAIMAAISIPLAVGATSIFLTLVGVSLNTMVLFSMVVVIGLVIDPTIVFLESIQRHLVQGYRGREAAAKTFKTVGIGIALAVITNFLVFIPFGVVSGIFGEIIRYIPITVVPAIIFSFIIPLLFYLPLGVRALRASRPPANNNVNPELIGVWRVAKGIGRAVKALLGPGFSKATLRVLIIIMAIVLPLAISWGLVATKSIRMVQFAETESDWLLISAEVNESWSFEKAVDDVAVPVQNVLRQQPEIRDFMYFPTGGTIYAGSGNNSFLIFADLFPAGERAKEDLKTGNELVEHLNGYFEKIDWAKVEAALESSGPPSSDFPVQFQLFDEDLGKLRRAADNVIEFVEDEAGVIEAKHSLEEEKSSQNITLVLDSDKDINRNPFITYSILKERLDENDLGNITIADEVYSLQTRLFPQIDSLRDVKETIIVQTPIGNITVDDAVEEFATTASQTIQRLDGRRYVDIKARVDDDTDPLAVQSAINEYLDKDKLEELSLDEAAMTVRGDFDMIGQSFTELFITLIVAMFLIYVLLVTFFRSLITPFIILFAIPLGLIGVMPAVAIVTGQLGFLELLGVVIMAGIVVNVSILLIDFANQLRREGYNPVDAIAVSTAVRLRPIFLTQATAFGSLVPLAVYAPFWSGMASVIVAGIIFSALLSLITTPILYIWCDALSKFVRRLTDRFSFN